MSFVFLVAVLALVFEASHLLQRTDPVEVVAIAAFHEQVLATERFALDFLLEDVV